MKPNPVKHRRSPHQIELIRAEVEEDHVANDIAVVSAGHELLRFVDRKALKTVHSEIGQELDRARPFHQQIRHVIGLIEEDTRLLPGTLFIAPIGVFRGNAGIDVRTDLLVSQELSDVSDRLKQVFEAGLAFHSRLPVTVGGQNQIRAPADPAGGRTSTLVLAGFSPITKISRRSIGSTTICHIVNLTAFGLYWILYVCQ